MSKRTALRKSVIVAIIIAILCFSCMFATVFLDGNNGATFGGKHSLVGSGTTVVTLNTIAGTVGLAGYIKNSETSYSTNTASLDELLPVPTETIAKDGATLTFLGWYKTDGTAVTKVQATDNNFTAHWKADVTSGVGLKNAESSYVREIYIMNDILLDQNPAVTNVTVAGGVTIRSNIRQDTDNVVFQALAPVKIFGNNHTISAFVTGTNAAGVCNNSANTSKYIIFYAGTSGTLDISDLTIYGGGKQALAVYSSLATMTNCTVSRSGSNIMCGGAIVVSTSGKLKATNCNFKRNVAQYAGAVLVTAGPNADNQSNPLGSTALFENCVINENRNVAVGLECGGGAIELKHNCKVYFVNSTLSNNQSSELGGGVNGNKGAHLYVINSTITGNVTAGTGNNFNYGGGLGGNNVTLHVYNSIVTNNYYYNTSTKVATPSDVGLYSGTLDAHNSIIGSVYDGDNRNVTSTYTGNGKPNKVGTPDKDFYRYDEIKLLDASGNVDATLPGNAQSPIITDDKIYLFDKTSSALNGGAYVYFNGDDIDNIRLGYGTDGTTFTKVLGQPLASDKIGLFKNGVLRDQADSIVIGALYSIPPGEEYVKITGQVSGQGTVDGYSIFSNYYRVGKDATFVAEAMSGYAFMGYYDVTTRPTGTIGGGTYLSSDLSYTFKVGAKDMILEARFVSAGEAEVFFTTYGGTLDGFGVSEAGQVYKKAYTSTWNTTAPRPNYNSGTFVGWYTDSTLQTVARFDNPNIKNYYAKVTDTITYKFKDNNNADITAPVTNLNTTTHIRNVEKIFEAPTLANYIFVEWRDSQNNPIVKFGQTVRGAQTVTGVFKQRTISFEGLTGADPNVIQPWKVTGQAQNVPTVTKVGFVFDGWSFSINSVSYKIASGGQFTAEHATLMDTNNIGNLVLTANWTEKAVVNFLDLTAQTYIYDPNGREFVVKTDSTHSAESGFGVEYYIGGAYTTIKPTTVGTYNVKISRAETTAYKAYSTEISGGLIIQRKALAKPTLSGSYEYSGALQTAVLDNNFDGGMMTATNNSQTNAGTYSTATLSAIKVTLRDKVNYKWDGEADSVSEIFIDWTINKKQLTVTGVTVADKTYDGNTSATANIATVDGIATVDKNTSLINVTATATFDTASAGDSKTVNITYQISGSKMANYLAPTAGTAKATINKKQLTVTSVTVADKIYDGDTSATANIVTVDGIVSVDINNASLINVTATATFDNASAEGSKTVNITYQISGSKMANYLVPTAGTANATINKKQLSVTSVTVSDKTYDGDTSATANIVTVDGIVSVDINNASLINVTATATFDNASAENSKTVNITYQISGTKSANYIAPTLNTANATISKKQLSVTSVNVADKTYDGDTSATANIVTVDGIVNVDINNASLINVTATATFDNASAGDSKTVNITYQISGTKSDNYIVPTAGTANAKISKADVTILNLAVSNKTYGDILNVEYTSFTKSAGTVNGVNSEKSIQGNFAFDFTAQSGQLSTGNFLKASTYNANYTFTSSNSNYNDKVGTVAFTVGKADLTATFSGYQNLIYNGTTPTINVALDKKAGDIVDANISYGGATVLNAANYTATATISGADSANYTLKNATQQFVIAQAILPSIGTISNVDYNGTKQEPQIVIGALQASIDFTISWDDNALVNAKTYTVTATGTGNYTGTKTETYTINKKQLSVTSVTVADKTYDGNTSATANIVTVDGIVSVDINNASLINVTATATFDNASAEGSKTVNITYQISGSKMANYLAPIAGTANATINKKQLTVTGVTVADKTYDGNTIATANIVTVDGIVPTDTTSEVVVSIATATFESASAEGSKTVNITYQISGTKSANYIAPTLNTANAKISKKQLTVTNVTVADKIYDGNTSATANIATVDGIATVDKNTSLINVTATATFDTASAGDNKTVNITYQISGTKSDNYIVPTAGTANAKINKKQLTVTSVTVADKIYDGSTSATTNIAKVDGIVNVDINDTSLINVTATATFDNASAEGSKTVNITYQISGSKMANYLVPTAGTANATINKKQLTVTGVTVADKTYDGNTSATANIVAVDGIATVDKNNASLINVTATANFVSASAEGSKTVNITYQINGTKSANYIVPTANTANATISKKQLTVTSVTVADKTYDGNTIATANNITVDGIVNVDKNDTNLINVTATATFITASAGDNKTVNISYLISGTKSANYIAPTLNTANAKISKKQLTVTNVTVADKIYDGDTSATANIVTVDGIVNVDKNNASLINVTATANFVSASAEGSKTVNITYQISGTKSTNYLAPIAGTANATINKADVAILNLALANKTYGDISNVKYTSFTKSAGTVNGVSPEQNIQGAFAFDFTAQSGQLSNGNFLKANTYNANYTFTSSNSNYNDKVGTVAFTVGKADLTATFSGHQNLIYNGKTPTITVALDKKGSDTVSADITYENNTQGGTTVLNAANYTATATISGADSANYTLQNATQQFEIRPFVVTVTIASATYTYDGKAKTTTADYTPMPQNDSLTVVLAYKNGNDDKHINAGTWEVKASATVAKGNATNYTIITDIGTMIIQRKALAKPTLSGSYVYSGALQIAVLDNNFDISTMIATNNSQTNAGTYSTATGGAIKVTLSDKVNYKWDGELDSVSEIFIDWTITPATITYNATGYSSVYDGTAHGISITGVKAVDNSACEITYSDSLGGTYSAMPIQFTDFTSAVKTVYFKIVAQNHNVVLDSKTVEITKATLPSITAMANVVYSGLKQAPNVGITGLSVNADFTILWDDSTFVNAKTYKVTATGKGNYTGESVQTYEITQATLPSITAMTNVVYNGLKQTPNVEITGLSVNTDFTILWDDSAFVNAKTYKVTATGKGNYTGESVQTYEITQATLPSITAMANVVYNGTKQEPQIVIGALQASTDFTILWDDSAFVNAKTYKVTATGKGNYTGESVQTYEITKATLPSIAVMTNVVYNGMKQTPNVEITGLSVNTDFIISWDDNALINAKTYTVTATGKGNYTGESIQTYEITKATLPSITAIANVVYSGLKQTPNVEITGLSVNADFTILWDDSAFVNAKTYTVTATGKGNYTGESVQTYEITKATLPSITAMANVVYNRLKQAPNVGITGLSVNKDFTIVWDDSTFINAKTYTVKATGKGNYTGESVQTYEITKATLPSITAIANVVYNGLKQTPNVEITGLSVNADFTILWDDSAFVNAKTYTVKATGKGNYTGESFQTYEITKAIIAEPTAGSKVYNGSKLTSDIAETRFVSITTNDGGTDVGEYDVVMALVDFANYKWETAPESQTRTIKFVITQAENAITNLHLKNWTYRESANAPTYDCNFGTPIFSYSAQQNSGYSSSVPSNIGVWFVKASVAETKNYKGAQAIQTFAIVAYTYNIAFDNGFGSDQTMPIQSRFCDDGEALTANIFERDGYVFVGWKIADSDIVLLDGAPGNICDAQSEMITLVAQWKKNVFTYAFLNDDLTLIFAKTANYGDVIELPIEPVKANSSKCSYRFIGWDKAIPEALTCDLIFVAQFAVKTIYGDIDQKEDGNENNCDIEVILPDNDKSILSMTIQDITEEKIISDIDNILKNTSIKEYGANKVLKVELLKDGKEVNFVGKYTVRLKEKPHDDFDIKIVQVVDGEMVEIHYEREGDYIVFDTISLGNIVVLEQNVDANLWMLVLSNMVLILLELGYLIFRKKPNKERNSDKPKGTKTNVFAVAPFGILGAINVIPMYLQTLLALQTIVVIVLAFVMAISFCKSKMRKKEKNIEIVPSVQPEIEQEFGAAHKLPMMEIAPIVALQTENVAPPEQIASEATAEEIVAEEEVAAEQYCEQTPTSDLQAPEVVVEADNDEGGGVGISIVEIGGKKISISLRKSFSAKLIQSNKEIQGYYSQLKNRLEGYKPIKSRMSWDNDSFNSGRNKLVKFAIRGKTLVMFAALSSEDIVNEKFHVEYSDTKKYADVPLMIRVKGPLKCKHASEIIDMVCAKFGLTLVGEKNVDYSQPYDTTESLIERNLIKVYADGDLNSADVIMAKFGQQGLHLIASATDGEEEREEKEIEKLEEEQDDDNDKSEEDACANDKEGDYIIVEGKKVYVSLRRSFLSKLVQVDSGIQKYYETIKNHILGYKNIKSRISWSNDTFNSGREKLVKLSIRGKTLVMNVALKPEDIEQDKYHVEYNNSVKYADAPMQIKVKGPLKLKHALELVDKVCEQNLLKFVANKNDDYTLPYKTNETLIDEGLIKVIYGAKWFGSKEV